MNTDIIEFLEQSNFIEGVSDTQALDDAVEVWRILNTQKVLSEHTILHAHRLLMKNQPIDEQLKGAWRNQPVWIGGKRCNPWYAIPELMHNWIKDAMTSVKVPGKEGEHIRLDHVAFEKIHPFIDGNGRIGRILMNWQRIRAGLPILVIKEFEKDSYYEWFK